MSPGASQAEKAAAFRALHEGEPFLIPNPWDAGSARVLEAFGFKALATTSSGFAFTPGRLDGGATLDNVAAHTRLLAAATGVPLSVDLENGYGPDPEDAAAAILRVAEAGAVGGSIESASQAACGWRWICEVLGHDRLGGRAEIRRLAREHLVHDASQRVDIATGIQLGIPRRLLRTHVCRGPH